MCASDCACCSKRNRFAFSPCWFSLSGIGGATTQFTVVNAIVLRGFSFPHPEQLVSVGLIDPKATAQNNNFGNRPDSGRAGLRRSQGGPEIVLR